MTLAPSAPWAIEPTEVARALGSDPAVGLASDEAAARLAETGPNDLVAEKRQRPWRRLVAQYTNTLSVVLAAAAAVTAVIGNVTDTAVIGAILVLNGLVGFTQEGRAERAVEALQRMAADTCRVRRDGIVSEIGAADLVPGDVVLLEAGEVVPADLRLVEAEALRVEEAALTGESEPVAKSVEALEASGGAMLADRTCMAYKGTSVVHGRGVGLVTATGMATGIGEVAALVQGHRRAPTPLQTRLAAVGRHLAAAALVVCVAVFLVGVGTGEAVDRVFLTAVSLAVAAIPEGLPAVVTVALALGARRMAERRAIVRRLPAVESLGSVTVICSDKTGTLTENRMLVVRAWTPAASYRVTGTGYAPDGDVTAEPPFRDGADAGADRFDVARVAAACNDASLRAPADPAGEWAVVGDPTEGALLAFAGKLGVDKSELERTSPRLAEIGFDPARRRMTTIHDEGGRTWVATKGALGALAPLLDPADAAVARAAQLVADRWAAQGFRVLALADRQGKELPHPLEAVESGLRLVGLVAITDPPRLDAAEAIDACRQAGITPVMITGDHPLTASAIARRLGITDGSDVMVGSELDALDDAELARRALHTRVYARTTPEQKLRIVAGWKANGAVVAMTGDGVNDAPALRLADIGVAMGVTGTDVSKEAADMVLADDDFSTIVHAVEEGRRIYDNIRRFVRYMLTTNSAEVWVMFLAPLISLPLPLLPLQILWINLITDGPPAIALGLEPADPDVLARPPRPPEESVLGGGLWRQALGVGLAMAVLVIATQAAARAGGWDWRTMVFTSLAFMQLGNAVASRSHGSFRRGLAANPWLAVAVTSVVALQLVVVYLPALEGVFDTRPLGAAELGVVFAVSTAGFWLAEAASWIARRRAPARDGGSR